MTNGRVKSINHLNDCLSRLEDSANFLDDYIADRSSDWLESIKGIGLANVLDELNAVIENFKNTIRERGGDDEA